jgi:hypothetical protein
MARVFISYASADRVFVERLVHDLDAAGVATFYDQRVRPGDSWATSLSREIESADFLLVVLSPRSVTSQWVEQEIRLGLGLEADGRTRVVPVLLEPCEIPALLEDRAYASFDVDYQTGLRRILAVLTGTSPMPANVPAATDAVHLAEVKHAVEQFKSVAPAVPAPPQPRAPADRLKCFVVMPFADEDLQVVYEDFVKPVLTEQCNLECERGDDVFGSNVIMDDIRKSIGEADLVLADLTRKNANVFYEVGISHTLDKPVLLLAQTMDDVPFDLRHRRVLLYDYTPRGCKRLEKMLREHVTAMLATLSGPSVERA